MIPLTEVPRGRNRVEWWLPEAGGTGEWSCLMSTVLQDEKF